MDLQDINVEGSEEAVKVHYMLWWLFSANRPFFVTCVNPIVSENEEHIGNRVTFSDGVHSLQVPHLNDVKLGQGFIFEGHTIVPWSIKIPITPALVSDDMDAPCAHRMAPTSLPCMTGRS